MNYENKLILASNLNCIFNLSVLFKCRHFIDKIIIGIVLMNICSIT